MSYTNLGNNEKVVPFLKMVAYLFYVDRNIRSLIIILLNYNGGNTIFFTPLHPTLTFSIVIVFVFTISVK